MIDILALGEALVDLISVEHGVTLDDVGTFHRYLGGSPVNVAATATRLGRKAMVLARVGDDAFGRFIRAEMQRLGLDDVHVQIDVQHPTTLVFVTKTIGTPDFQVIRGADAFVDASASAELNAPTLLAQAVADARAVHITSWVVSIEPCRTTALSAIAQAHAQGKIVSLDPNFRARIWPAPAEVHSVLRNICPLTTLIKPSLDDAVAIWGPGATPSDYIAQFHAYGAPNVLLTMGKHGVLVSDGTTQTSLPAEPVAIADATGAGDAFTAGAILTLIDGADIVTAARVGQYIAASKLRGVGHAAPLPHWMEVRERFGV